MTSNVKYLVKNRKAFFFWARGGERERVHCLRVIKITQRFGGFNRVLSVLYGYDTIITLITIIPLLYSTSYVLLSYSNHGIISSSTGHEGLQQSVSDPNPDEGRRGVAQDSRQEGRKHLCGHGFACKRGRTTCGHRLW